VFEAYFHGYRHDSTVSSFSVAKPVVSALVGIAIAQGRIGSVDDPVTRYLPELADRDPRFGTITLRHLLTMSSGLADLDPYYDLDLRAVALRDTRIAGPAGRRFHYNNVNPVLLGMVLERATGRTVSTYLPSGSGGRWAWRPTAPGAWTAAARGWNCSRPVSTAGPSTSPSSAPSTCTGASGGDASSSRAAGSPTRPGPTPGPTPRPGFQYDWWTRPGTGPGNDFWAQGNHGQFVYVAPSRDVVLVRFGTGYHYDHWPDRLATLARRL
jgi:CubicO group peptidase (beta-lactamase class C family)